MKLLIDQNLSYRVLKMVEEHFQDITHVATVGLANSTDRHIWDYAKKEGFTIVTFDSDFYEFGLVWGAPPKVVLLRSFNQTTQNVARLLILYKDSFLTFGTSQELNCLELIDPRSDSDE